MLSSTLYIETARTKLNNEKKVETKWKLISNQFSERVGRAQKNENFNSLKDRTYIAPALPLQVI